MIPKFRAWDKANKKLCDVKTWSEFNGGEVTIKRDGENASYVVSLDDIILMQSTGMVDKNSVEVFEGDVVKVDGWKTEVVKFGKIIHEEDFGGFAIYQGYSLMLGGGYPEAVMNEIEVIGNIYELERVEE